MDRQESEVSVPRVGTLTRIGYSGHIDPPSGISVGHYGYNITLLHDELVVQFDDGAKTWHKQVEGLVEFTAHKRPISIGWAIFPDDAEVIYIYDKSDHNWGYALNLMCDWNSEWGYAPFAYEGVQRVRQDN